MKVHAQAGVGAKYGVRVGLSRMYIPRTQPGEKGPARVDLLFRMADSRKEVS